MPSDSILLKHVVPALGTGVAWAMFLAPLKAVIAVRRSKALGVMNPLPLVAMWANCAAWLVYAFLIVDPYVLASNLPGLILAAFMTVTCYGYADERARDTMLCGIVGFSALLFGAGAFLRFAGLDHAKSVALWGFVTVGILLIFYAAPLSSIAEVLRARNSAALNEPLALMAVLNGSLWGAYGWAVGDPFIWGPNLVGALFGVLQVSLVKAYPSKPSDPKVGGEEAASMMRDAEGARFTEDSAAAGGGGRHGQGYRKEGV
ncbi:MAG: sugar efflux transporter for intercellular exchange-domain-containing protein [Monoraphidium minutum]|nr:MAG: sugar efflux transporter for intercellular exchange-domain-containing protein [Monoraphidium minutum]